MNVWTEKYNAIAKQLKSRHSKITDEEWNFIINSLAEQTNNNTKGIIISQAFMENVRKIILEKFASKTSEMVIAFEAMIDNIPNKYPEIFEMERFQISKESPEDPGVTLWIKLED